MDAGGFQGLNKAAGETQGNAVFIPVLFALASAKFDNSRFCQGRALNIL